MGEVLFSVYQHQYFIIIKGDLRYSQGNSFYNFIKNMLEDYENHENFLIDLRECTFLDSTNLGLLAKIANYAIKNNKPKPVILSTNPEINTLLESVGFDSVFFVTAENIVVEQDGVVIDQTKAEESNISTMILDAHKELVNINAKNKDTFKDVIHLFEQESK